MFGRQSDIMNDKSKKKSIIMALAVFVAIAAFASPLFMSDDNSDSNTVMLGDGEFTLPEGWAYVADQTAINNASESNLVLSGGITGDLTIPTGKALYGIYLAETPVNSGAPEGAKTITGIVTLEAGATLNYVTINGSVSITDPVLESNESTDANETTTETKLVNDKTFTTIQYCTIGAGNVVAISYLDIQAGNITINSNIVSNDSTAAVLNFEGARDETRDVTATSDVFKLNILNNTISIEEGKTARAISLNDKIGADYEGGSEISITGNTITDSTTWSGSIAFRGLNENSKLTVINNIITNSGSADSQLGFSGVSHLAGLTTDVESLIVEGEVELSENFDSSSFEKITINGTLSYNGSSISNATISAVDAETPILKLGSLIINGEVTPSDEDKPIVVSGTLDLAGNLTGTLVVLPAETTTDGIIIPSDVVLHNLNIDDGDIEYKVTRDGEAVDQKTVANVKTISIDEAGREVTLDSYTDRGVTVDVHDLDYNGKYQDAPVVVEQYTLTPNNIKALTAIEYYAPGSDTPVFYKIDEYKTGINKNGISAGIDKLNDNTLGFENLKITDAGKYVLVYSVTTSEQVEGKYVVDHEFKVEFNVHQKFITSIGEIPPIKIYDTTADVPAISSEDIFKGDDVSFDAHYFTKNIGYWPVIITGLSGEDKDNYMLSDIFNADEYISECVDDCYCSICQDGFQDYLGDFFTPPGDTKAAALSDGDLECTCDNCMCNYPVQGLILPKVITEDMIEVTKTYLSLDKNLIYPIITITLLDVDKEGNPVTVTLDTSGMSAISDRNDFNGSFVSSNGYESDFIDGIDYTHSLDWTAMISELNSEEFDNYAVAPFIAGAVIGYSNSDPAEEISEILNLIHTIDHRNEPITDVIDNTMFMSYYLADDLDGKFTFVLVKENAVEDKTLYSEVILNLSNGMRAWYFSFNDQAEKYVNDIEAGNYYINIFAGNDLIGTFSFEIEESDDALYASDVAINWNDDPAVWASKKAFSVTPGYVIKYHYLYDSNTSGIDAHQHITQIINPMFLNTGVSYYISNVGVNNEMIFLNWTTLDINERYDDAVPAIDGQTSFAITPMMVIDGDFLNRYVDMDTGVLNLYADYFVFDDPVDPKEDKSIERVSNGYSSIDSEAKDYMAAYGVYLSDIDNHTAWMIYDQKGYTDSNMTGVLYKIVDGERIKVFEENLNSDDGRRAWYFSFDNQARPAVDDGDFSGLYMMNICADGEVVLERPFEIYNLDYAVTVSADYAVDKETSAEGVRVSIEPKEGSVVPNGMVSVVYSYFEKDSLLGDVARTTTSEMQSINESSTTQSLLIDTKGISSGHAIFEWTIDGVTIYSLSNAVVPTK